MLNLFALLAACSSPTTPEPAAAGDEATEVAPEQEPEAAPPAPANAEAAPHTEPVMHTAEPGHAGIIELLGSAGACKAAGIEKPRMAMEWSFKGQKIYAAECEGYAYQSDFEWWVQSADALTPIKRVDGSPLTFLGYPSFNAETGEASWLSKARGIGDCGDWQSYTLDGTTFTLKEHRSRACDDNPEAAGPPHQWPLQASISAPATPAELEAAVEGKVDVIINELSGEEAGKNITRAADGDLFGVPCKAMISAYTDTWGCETTAPFTRDGYTTRAGMWVAIHYGTGKRAGIVFSDLEPASEGATVQGVPCKDFAHFHADGSLSGCMLSAATTFGKAKPPAGTDIQLRKDGSLESATVYTAFSIGDTKVPEGMISFDTEGNMTHAAEGIFGD